MLFLMSGFTAEASKLTSDYVGLRIMTQAHRHTQTMDFVRNEMQIELKHSLLTFAGQGRKTEVAEIQRFRVPGL